MMRFFCFFVALLTVAVSSLKAAPSNDWHVIKSKELGSLPEGAVLQSVKVSRTHGENDIDEVHVEGLVFDTNAFTLQVVDNPVREKAAAEILREQHFLAGVNGSYFYPDGTPLGLVLSHGKLIHASKKARLLSGILVVTPHRMQLLRVEEKLPSDALEALQAGPFLLDRGGAVVGLEATRSARRTFLATDNHGRWLVGVISPTTLAEAARILLAVAPQFFPTTKVERALNLDGGSSSALWVDLKPEPFSQQEFGRVRNFLGLRLNPKCTF